MSEPAAQGMGDQCGGRPATPVPAPGCLRKFLLFGVCGKPRRNSIIPLYVMFGCVTLPYAFLSSLTPEVLKTPLHVNMCPNITAAHAISINVTSHDGGPDTGYALKAAQDSVGGICSFVGAIVAGMCADKMTRKGLIMIGLLGGTVPYLALMWTCDNYFYIPLASLAGATDSALFIGVSSYIADLVPPPNRAIAYGRVLICPVIVLTLISPVGVMCAAAYKETHLRSIFAIAASLSFVPLVFAVVFLPEPIKGPASGAARDAPADDCRDAPADPRCREAARAGEETNDDAAYPADERPGAPGKSVWTRQLAVLVVVAVLINFPSNATHSLLILYITNRFQACQEECISFILSLFSVSFAVCSIVYIPVAIRIMGTRATLMLGLIFSSVCLSCYALATKLDTIFLTFALEVPALAIQSCLSALFTEAVPKERVGYATGLLTATQTLTQVVSPVFFAVILSSWLSTEASRAFPGLPWLCAVAFNILALLLCACLLPTTSEASDRPAADGTDDDNDDNDEAGSLPGLPDTSRPDAARSPGAQGGGDQGLRQALLGHQRVEDG